MVILDYKDRRPIYEQLVEKLEDLIVRDVLEQDSQMPSVRNLAMELSINPNTIQRAYAELERRGFIYTVKGRGSFVAKNQGILAQKREELLKELEAMVGRAKFLQVSKEIFLASAAEYYDKEGQQYD